MARFKKGQTAWIHYPNGELRVGVIIAQVNRRQLPNPKFKFSKRPGSRARPCLIRGADLHGAEFLAIGEVSGLKRKRPS